MCDPRTPPSMGWLVRTEERWQMRSAHGPVQLKIQSGIDALVFAGDAVAQEHTADPALPDVDCQHFTVIPDDGSGLGGFGHPLGDQAFGKLALRIFVIEDRPLVACVEGALHPLQFHFAQVGGFPSRNALVQPQAGADVHGAALALLVQQKQKMHRMHQVRAFAQQALAFASPTRAPGRVRHVRGNGVLRE